MIIRYNPHLKKLAANLRNQSTKSEIRLWKYLKDKQLGHRFIRQKPIGNYIVDFYCKEKKLAIELDGYSHRFEEVVEKDEKKETHLHTLDIRVIRFNDSDVMEDIDNVIATIEDNLLSSLPSREGPGVCEPGCEM